MISRSLMMMSENAPSIRRSAVEDVAAIVGRLGEQMKDDLAIRGRLEDRALALEFVAQDAGVDQVAVMRDGELPAEAIDHEGLRILQRARAGGGIAGVADGARAFEAFQGVLPENLRDQAHVAMQQEAGAGAIRGHDARAFLAAMLERKEAVIGQDGGVRMPEDGENAALVHRVGRWRWQGKLFQRHEGGKDTHSARNFIFPAPISFLSPAAIQTGGRAYVRASAGIAWGEPAASALYQLLI